MYPRRVACEQILDQWSECQGNSKDEQVRSANNWVNRGSRICMFPILPWHLEQNFAAAVKTFKVNIC